MPQLKAAARLEQRVVLVEALHDFVEGRLSPQNVEQRLHGFRRIGVVPGIELVETREFMARGRRVAGTCEPSVDVARRLLSMADRDRDVALRGHHVAAGENSGMPGHHVRVDLHDAIVNAEARNPVEQTEIDVLAEREHDAIRIERLEFAGRLRKTLRHRAPSSRP